MAKVPAYLLPAEALRVGQARAVRIHAVNVGSAAARVGLVAGELLLRAGELPLYGVDGLKRALVLGEGRAVSLEIQGQRERKLLEIAPDPARSRAA